MSITQRALEVVHRDLTAGQEEFSFELHLDFTPTHMIVRSINYTKNGETGDNNLHMISAPWANHHPIGVFIDDNNGNYCSNPNSIISLGDAGGALINGQVVFHVEKLTNTKGAHDADGVLALTLEFYQQEKEKPDNLLTEMRSLVQVLKTPKNDVFPFNPLPAQYGGEFTGDTRHALDQINPIPNVFPEGDRVLPVIPDKEPEKKEEEKKEEEKKEEEKKE